MKLVHYDEVELEDVDIEGAKDTKIRWLISQKDNAPNFAMRMFEVQPGGYTPYHKHDWEHESFILEGEGALVTEEGEKPFKAWDVLYIEPNMMHRFKNTGKTLMRFLCIIPHQSNYKKLKEEEPLNPFASGVANNC